MVYILNPPMNLSSFHLFCVIRRPCTTVATVRCMFVAQVKIADVTMIRGMIYARRRKDRPVGAVEISSSDIDRLDALSLIRRKINRYKN
jgi:hypothetical protein